MTNDVGSRMQIRRHGMGWRLHVYEGKGVTKNYRMRRTFEEAEKDLEDVKQGRTPQEGGMKRCRHGSGWRLRVYEGKGVTKNYSVRRTLEEAEKDLEDVKQGRAPQRKQRGSIECRDDKYRARMWVKGKTCNCVWRSSMEEAMRDLSVLRSDNSGTDSSTTVREAHERERPAAIESFLPRRPN